MTTLQAFPAKMAVLLTLALASCGQTGSSLPGCTPGTCGPHGTCQEGACLCDPGFQPAADGLACIPYGFDACEGFDCSGLGHCAIEPEGPYGLEIPVCICDPGAVRSDDSLDCLDPCADQHCTPGNCIIDAAGQGACDCPPGWAAGPGDLTCAEKTRFAWDLVYDPEGDAWVMGRAWLTIRRTATGLQAESTSQYAIPISYNGSVGGTFHSLAWFDESGQLQEFVGDQQTLFGRFSARRRLHFSIDRSGDTPRLVFESNILDRIWHGEFPLAGAVPIPMAEGYEYPAFSYGCFDPFFFFALGRAVDPAAGAQQVSTILLPSFVLPAGLALTVGTGEETTIDLDGWGVRASYAGGLLTGVDYGWISWLEVPPSAALETNMRALPTTPQEHEVDSLAPLLEEAVTIVSADGTALAGSLALPPGALERTAVLLVPGLFPSHRDKGSYHTRIYYDLAARLAQGGVASLRLDDRGVGESEGQTNDPPAALAADLDAAYHWLAADPRFDQVVLLAHSFSTPRALAAAARLPAAGLILLAPTGDDLVADWYHRMEAVVLEAFADPELAAAYYQDFGQAIAAIRDGSSDEDFYERSAAFWRAWLDRDPLEVSGITAPVLILHGEEDLSLPVANLGLVAAAFAAAGNPPAAHPLPGLSNSLAEGAIDDLWELYHLPQTVSPLVTNLILDWLAALPARK